MLRPGLGHTEKGGGKAVPLWSTALQARSDPPAVRGQCWQGPAEQLIHPSPALFSAEPYSPPIAFLLFYSSVHLKLTDPFYI